MFSCFQEHYYANITVDHNDNSLASEKSLYGQYFIRHSDYFKLVSEDILNDLLL